MPRDEFWNPYAAPEAPRRRLLGLAAVLGLLVLWSAVAASGLVSPSKLPAPWDVVAAFGYLAWHDGQSMLLTATLWSVGRLLVAGVLVIMIGIPIGIVMGAAPQVNAALSPLVDPFRSAPVVALLPILVMWMGIGEAMKIAFLFIGAVVYLIPMVRDAIQAVPQSYWIGARDLGATPWECIQRAVIPLAMPRIADAVIVAFSVMWTYITVAEYVNAREGLGQLIQNARRFSAWDQVFAGIIVIIALALATYQFMVWLKRRLYPWETQQ
ncbi:MAG TPA: ABC transporter permease [Accumulibacter sp.]|uniref:ABC transporter permease n=1 Tax=Accumulibacter sp. TaxID=2053492 RepID=UPI00262782B7|nr:ABC transporter permease [Accumulibacter sp.]MDS4055447.1 ABC transporter permease [Accumulibacter sp.]HMV05711.1 ABC transporter permease [Accumulibacter sp.]HMW63951.1 ABC transporter permease [Accumulibacter sp.]HMW80754.1 ABC transporter permease [Accumulibacter sp.]HNB66574.1 ABC transporter permease [Accumulibacter sp.]